MKYQRHFNHRSYFCLVRQINLGKWRITRSLRTSVQSFLYQTFTEPRVVWVSTHVCGAARIRSWRIRIPTRSAGDWQRAQQVSKCPFHPKLIHQILSITLDFWLNGLVNILLHFRQAYSPVIVSAQQFFKSLKGQNLLVQDCSQNNWQQTKWYSLCRQAGF